VIRQYNMKLIISAEPTRSQAILYFTIRGMSIDLDFILMLPSPSEDRAVLLQAVIVTLGRDRSGFPTGLQPQY